MPGECVNCPLRDEIKDLKTEVKALEDKYSSSRKLIYERLERLDRSAAVTDDRYVRILHEIEEINARLKALSEQPQKRWDTAVTVSITSIISGVIGFVIAKLFGGG